jgi:U3 small nucleolar ribonucleoprotein component
MIFSIANTFEATIVSLIMNDPKERLIDILRSRGISLGLDDIQWAFDSETTKRETVAWIEEYLNDSTLLSRDEFDLYNAIGDSAKLELSSASHDVVPLLDRDIKEAIAALKSSTSAIENHAKALEAQKEVLVQLQRGSRTSNSTSKISAKYAQERSSLNFAVRPRICLLYYFSR